MGTAVLSTVSLREFVQPSRLPVSGQEKVQALKAIWSKFWSMVPDELEMAHRHICSLQLTKETAAEMIDAAAAAEATAASKKHQ